MNQLKIVLLHPIQDTDEEVFLLNKEHYNLIHLNSSKAGLIGALAAKTYNLNPLNLKMRVIYTAHGFVFNEPLAKIEKIAYKFSERFSTSIQHIIITVSHFDKKSAVNEKICSPHKMFTVHNGLDFSQYDFLNREQAREKLNLSYDKKYFGTIGSFYTTKGYPHLIEAIKLLKEEKSELHPKQGDVSTDQAQELLEKLQKEGTLRKDD